MNARLGGMKWAAAAMLALLIGSRWAPAADQPVTITADVWVTFDEADNTKVVMIALRADDGDYFVELNDKGKTLGAMDGKTVQVTGTVAEKEQDGDKTKWITVIEVKEVAK